MSVGTFFFTRDYAFQITKAASDSVSGSVSLINFVITPPEIINIPESVVDASNNSLVYDVTSLSGSAFNSPVSGFTNNTTTSITIPSSIVSIYAVPPFTSCTILQTIEITRANTFFNTDSYGVLYSSSRRNGTYDTLYTVPADLYTVSPEYTIPVGITSIGDYAFYQCSSLTSLTIPTGVTSIGNAAFFNCDALTSLIITIPSSVNSIGSGAFELTPLTSLTINGLISSFYRESLALIQNQNTGGSYTLESLTFGGNVTDTTQPPGGIGINNEGGYYDPNYIFIESLTNNAVIQVPGPNNSSNVYSNSIVEAIKSDIPEFYPESNFTFSYNVSTSSDGVEYVQVL
jgi:hypothetical protein